MEKLKVPTTMMTQHPDSCKYIPVQEEAKEAIFSLTSAPKGLGLEEAMVDFEGKLTPYQQTSQVTLGLLSKGIIPGKDVFVTPRISSSQEESVFRQLMTLMSVVESNYHSWKQTRIYGVREIILPMCTGVKELLAVRERVIDVIDLAHKEFKLSKDPNSIGLIPLIETIPQILEVETILEKYIEGCEEMGLSCNHLRYMLGRSDLALSYGLVSAVLAIKIALSLGYRVKEKRGIEISPILGGGTLPFRGHLTLENIENTLRDYPGVRTLTVQSAMRYDHGFAKTRKLAALLKEKLPKSKPIIYDEKTIELLKNIAGVFIKEYLKTFYLIAETVCKISDLIPSQRDRLARKSEVGYARDLPHPKTLTHHLTDKQLAQELSELEPKKSLELPRAISYTASLYSIGLPPEIIGTGRGLNEIAERYGNDVLNEFLTVYYPGLKSDLSFACRFVNLENASSFLPSKSIEEIKNDLKYIEKYLGIKAGPKTKSDTFYSTILETMKPMLKQIMGEEIGEIIKDEQAEFNLVKEWIIKLGNLRGGLG